MQYLKELRFSVANHHRNTQHQKRPVCVRPSVKVSGMKEYASPTPLIVMTIGHSTRSAKEFIHILKAHRVKRGACQAV